MLMYTCTAFLKHRVPYRTAALCDGNEMEEEHEKIVLSGNLSKHTPSVKVPLIILMVMRLYDPASWRAGSFCQFPRQSQVRALDH